MICKEKLDTRICDDIEGATNKQTYREFIRECEKEFKIEERPLDDMNDFDLQDHVEYLDYLCGK